MQITCDHVFYEARFWVMFFYCCRVGLQNKLTGFVRNIFCWENILFGNKRNFLQISRVLYIRRFYCVFFQVIAEERMERQKVLYKKAQFFVLDIFDFSPG